MMEKKIRMMTDEQNKLTASHELVLATFWYSF